MSIHHYEFDQAMALDADGDGRWRGEVLDGWDFAGMPNGGYLLALAAAPMAGVAGHPDPVTVTAHYVAPARPGGVVVEAEPVRSGRRLGTARARLIQDDRPIAHLLGTFGVLDGSGDALRHEAGLPQLPPPERCVAPAEVGGEFRPPPITERVEMRLHPDHTGFALARPHGRAEMAGWARFPDGRPIDARAVLLIADAFPPPVFNAGLPLAWVPTIELTVHVHKRPAPGWLGTWFRTDHIGDGYLEEDGLLWDEDGEVVAVSRQMAIVPR